MDGQNITLSETNFNETRKYLKQQTTIRQIRAQENLLVVEYGLRFQYYADYQIHQEVFITNR